MKKIKLFTGTNERTGDRIMKHMFDDISWWSADRETIEHYYEGCIIEMTLMLDEKLADDYIADIKELVIPLTSYKYGFADVHYPEGARWYSFSFSYLNAHVVSTKIVDLDYVKAKLCA